MTKNNLLASINSRIEGIAKSSAAFKSDLAAVVRELLVYVPDSGDIGSVNRLLLVLNKTDRAMTVAFFRNFLPWKYDGVANGGMFTTKSNNKPRVSAMFTNISTWLKDEKNNIWDWQKEQRPRPELPVAKLREQTVNRIENTIHRALDPKTPDGKNENKARLNPELVLNAVLNSGITLEQMMEFINKAAEIRKAEQEKLEKLQAEQAAIAGKNAKQDNTPAKKKAA